MSARAGIHPLAEQRTASRGPAFWRDALEPYIKADRRRSLCCVLTPVVPYVALFVLMALSLRMSYLLALALAIPAAGFLVRTYIVVHDCAHGLGTVRLKLYDPKSGRMVSFAQGRAGSRVRHQPLATGNPKQHARAPGEVR